MFDIILRLLCMMVVVDFAPKFCNTSSEKVLTQCVSEIFSKRMKSNTKINHQSPAVLSTSVLCFFKLYKTFVNIDRY